MFCEAVRVEYGDTVPSLAVQYGYPPWDWRTVWEHPANDGLVSLREDPDWLEAGDTLWIPIPWRVVSMSLRVVAHGAHIDVWRDGELGRRLTWVQTVYQHNQPVAGTNAFCVDGCPADDELPFYWTNAEIARDVSLRKHFWDESHRSAPAAAAGTTRWRAIVSAAVATQRRVTIWDSIVWGWDMTPANAITTVGPRWAAPFEIEGHINLLTRGVGKSGRAFDRLGWTFRRADDVFDF